jgi:hypothetical protein
MEDPGRLPYRGLMNEARCRERAAEARAELHARLHVNDEARTTSARGVRRVLRGVRDAVMRHR